LTCAAVLALALGPATAQDLPPVADLAAIANWVATEMGLPLPVPLPAVVFTDPDTLSAMFHGTKHAGNVAALYDPARQVIHLPTGWSGTTPAETSMLVHEVVHHLQAVTGQTFACPGAREKPAYDLQARWLARFGDDLTHEFDLDPLFLHVATLCAP
jgi:hypothetical protein